MPVTPPETGRVGAPASLSSRPATGRLLHLRGTCFQLGERTLIMGILNVTPDSFSDGGRFLDAGRAVARGLELAADGADLVDVGGESTRPGAAPVDDAEEWRRVGPVIRDLAARGVPVSVDTTKAEVARRALDAGAILVNDISGGTREPDLLRVTAAAGAGLVVTHILGTPDTMQRDPRYDDLMGEIAAFLSRQTRAAREAGVALESLVIDPGLGFGKRPEHNVEILGRLSRLFALPYPIMVGASRKSFIGLLTGLPPADRLEGSLGAAAAAALAGADLLRVHDVRETARALAVVDAVKRVSAAESSRQPRVSSRGD
jgi:dihydropteroate synthase